MFPRTSHLSERLSRFLNRQQDVPLAIPGDHGSQVDTICYCTGGGGLFWGHNPRAGELIGEYVVDTDAQYVKDICKSLRALDELGTEADRS